MYLQIHCSKSTLSWSFLSYLADFGIPYSRYYKPPLYLFLRLFGAASIQEFVHFPSFSTVELHFGAASIQERLLFKRGL